MTIQTLPTFDPVDDTTEAVEQLDAWLDLFAIELDQLTDDEQHRQAEAWALVQDGVS